MNVEPWDLVARSKAGDAEAFGKLYDLYLDDIYGFIHALVEDHPTTEDLTADTFFKALRGIQGLEPTRDTPRAWLITIARNTVRDHVRSARVRLTSPTGELPDVPDDDPDAYQKMARDHDAVMIRGLIRRLTGDQRRCLELRWLDGLTLAEVAEEMDRTTGAVALLHMRAVRRLQKMIEDGEP